MSVYPDIVHFWHVVWIHGHFDKSQVVRNRDLDKGQLIFVRPCNTAYSAGIFVELARIELAFPSAL